MWARMDTAPRDGTRILIYGYYDHQASGLSEAPEIGVAEWAENERGEDEWRDPTACYYEGTWHNPICWHAITPVRRTINLP